MLEDQEQDGADGGELGASAGGSDGDLAGQVQPLPPRDGDGDRDQGQRGGHARPRGDGGAHGTSLRLAAGSAGLAVVSCPACRVRTRRAMRRVWPGSWLTRTTLPPAVMKVLAACSTALVL